MKNYEEFIKKINSLNFNELDADKNVDKKMSFTTLIKEIIKKFDDNEFNINHISSALKKIGYNEKTDKVSRLQISSKLNRMKKSGDIECILQGSGPIPSVYKNKANKS